MNKSLRKRLWKVEKLIFFKRFLFVYSQRGRDRQREKKVACREPNAGLDPGAPRSPPELKADAQPSSHPGVLKKRFINTCGGRPPKMTPPWSTSPSWPWSGEGVPPVFPLGEASCVCQLQPPAGSDIKVQASHVEGERCSAGLQPFQPLCGPDTCMSKSSGTLTPVKPLDESNPAAIRWKLPEGPQARAAPLSPVNSLNHER